jgi:hypothetical protein
MKAGFSGQQTEPAAGNCNLTIILLIFVERAQASRDVNLLAR